MLESIQIPFTEVFSIVLTFVFAYLLWRIQNQKEKIKTIENQLSDKKYNLYTQVVEIFFEMLKATKSKDNIDEEALIKKMFEIKSGMLLYAPDPIFNAFTEWTLLINKSTADSLEQYVKMIRLIRKEMVTSSKMISYDQMMVFFMQNKEEYEKFKKAHN